MRRVDQLRAPKRRPAQPFSARAVVVAALVALSLVLIASSALGRRGEKAAQLVSRLIYSTASNYVVQPQPAVGSCHAIGFGIYSRPDPRCTPGAVNPQVTQVTIGGTICQRGWTSRVRPPEAITEAEKRASMAAYGDHASTSRYEYDHFVPLELGGATNAAQNLWPEPGPSPNPKDSVEDALNREVCEGRVTLAAAQRAIAANWISLVRPRKTRSTQTKPTVPSTPAARCSASAQYSSRYDDYDVYVYSNQPDQTVTVTDGGKTATWHTDGSGYADVYFYASQSAAGERITVRVSAATCSTTL